MSNKQELKAVPKPQLPTEKVVSAAAAAPEPNIAVEAPSPAAPPNPRLHEVDRLNLELAKSNRKTALAQAKQAIAESELAELSYKNFVLQLYMRYGLNDQDAISEAGEILKGQAKFVNKQGQ